MISFKEQVAQLINNAIENQIEEHELLEYIEIPPNREMGDYAFPCFKLAKVLKKAPNIIAEELKEKIVLDEYIERVEIAGGYLNFYVNKNALIKTVLNAVSEEK